MTTEVIPSQLSTGGLTSKMLTETHRLTSRRTTKPYIICVDDEKHILDSLGGQLRPYLGNQYNFIDCQGGEEAIEQITELLAKGDEVAVIVSDVIMPGQKGDEFLIQASKLTPKTMLILITGKTSDENLKNAVSHVQLYRFITKPWEMVELQQTVERAGQAYQYEAILTEQNAVLKLLHEASQFISQKLKLEEVYEAFMQQILDYSGAEKAILALMIGKELEPQAQLISGGKVEFIRDAPRNSLHYPERLLYNIAERQQELVLNTTTAQSFREGVTNDAYLREQNPRSLLVLPLRNVGQLIGVIYLDHKELTNLFPPERVELIKILANQAAISIGNAHLYKAVEETVYDRTIELMSANTYKAEMMRVLSLVSHEIRSPLSGVASLASLLKGEDMAANREEVMKYAEMIQKSTSNVLKLAASILDLAKLESGTTEVEHKPLELSVFLAHLVDGFQPLVNTKHLTLMLDAPQQLTINTDEGKLSLVINNLVNNAIKFTPKAGHIEVRLRKSEHNGQSMALVQVTDTGLGIAADQMPKLFEKFGVKQRAGTNGEKGTGLGLALVQELVTILQGEIAGESEPGKGSTFSVYLPLDSTKP